MGRWPGEFSQKVYVPEMMGMRNLNLLKLILRPWDPSHRVERQKLMAISWEEMSERVQKGGFMASLLLR